MNHSITQVKNPQKQDAISVKSQALITEKLQNIQKSLKDGINRKTSNCSSLDFVSLAQALEEELESREFGRLLMELQLEDEQVKMLKSVLRVREISNTFEEMTNFLFEQLESRVIKKWDFLGIYGIPTF